MTNKHLVRALVIMGLLGWGLHLHADFQIAPVFSDHMVLQRGQPLTVWGWADDGEKITVKFRGQQASTTARNGKWSLRLRRAKVGGPDIFTVSSPTRTVTFTSSLWARSGSAVDNQTWNGRWTGVSRPPTILPAPPIR